MKNFTALWLVSSLGCASGCAGHAVDLDRSVPAAGTVGTVDSGVPVETAPVRSALADFWADDSRIYWNLPLNADHGSNYGCVFDQCASTTLRYGASDARPSIWMLPVGDDILFSAPDDSALRCPKTGCVGDPTPMPGTNLGSAASDASYLYWSAQDNIYRCPIANCGDIPELVARRVDADNLHVQGDNVYWASEGDTNAWILSAPSDGSQKPSTIVARDAEGAPSIDPSGAQIQAFTLDSARVYWVDTDSQVRACSLRGCQPGEPAVIPTDADQKFGLVADATGFYWIAGGNVVRYCPSAGCKAGSAPKNLSTAQALHFQLTPNYVYWSQNQPTDPNEVPLWLVYRTPKPNQNQ